VYLYPTNSDQPDRNKALTDQFDAIEKFETLAAGEKTLVGLYQEVRLSQDEDGGEDGMWFDEAVRSVSTDSHKAVKFVACNWPQGAVSVSAVKNHCGV